MNTNKKKILAIIPARQNSKNLKNKNIRLLNGHPLLSYSVIAAVKSKLIDKVICSTDSKYIARIAKKYGAEVPFLRPKEIAQDQSEDLELFKHTLKWLENNENYIPDIVIHLRPTSPIRFKKDINKAIKIILEDSKIDSVRSLSVSKKSPYKMWKINNNKFINPVVTLESIKEAYNKPRQKLPQCYIHNGNIDVIRLSTILKKNSMTGNYIAPIILDERYSIDIDDLNDLMVARKIISRAKCIKPN